MSHSLIATCAFGLEAVVKRELADLGYDAHVLQPGWVGFAGDEDAIVRTNLWLRCADRVLIEVASFEARDFDQLFETTRDTPWSQLIPAYGKFPVRGRSVKSQLSSVPACQRSVKRAVAESLQRGHGVTTLPESGALYQIEIALRDDHARLTLDTTGPSLHKRGYRKLVGEAPLKETLAAAMILLSVWKPDRPFIDPFCGSGTLPIEAAMIGRQIAPGSRRNFSAEEWPMIAAATWKQEKQRCEDIAQDHQDAIPTQLIGTDIDAEVLSLARYHAGRAGVESDVHFQQRPFDQLRSKKEYGCLVTNPPYGERLKERDMVQFYRALPQILQRLPSWSHFILTAFPRFEAVIQKSATRRRKLFNGRIECYYYQYLGPRPPSLDRAAADGPDEKKTPSAEKKVAFGGLSDQSRRQAELFAARLTKRARHLRRWPTKRKITCFRLYERDIPEIPLVVDRYEDDIHILEYERPHDRDIGEHAAWQELMCRTAAGVLDVDVSRVFFKSRERQKAGRQHRKLGQEQAERVVTEGELKFIVNLSDYVDTGLFLDHRITRDMVRRESRDKRVLNLFGYTGAFTVYAAAGGAKSVTHVDLSRIYIDWARENLKLNDLYSPACEFNVADVESFLDSLPESPKYDLVVVDPPTFSNSKKTSGIWDVQKQHLQLLTQVRSHLNDGGVVYFSTNFRRFRLDDAVENLFAQVIEISRQTVPEDFRNRRIHRCWRMTA